CCYLDGAANEVRLTVHSHRSTSTHRVGWGMLPRPVWLGVRDEHQTTNLGVGGSNPSGAPATLSKHCSFCPRHNRCFHELFSWKQYGSSTHLFLFSAASRVAQYASAVVVIEIDCSSIRVALSDLRPLVERFTEHRADVALSLGTTPRVQDLAGLDP